MNISTSVYTGVVSYVSLPQAFLVSKPAELVRCFSDFAEVRELQMHPETCAAVSPEIEEFVAGLLLLNLIYWKSECSSGLPLAPAGAILHQKVPVLLLHPPIVPLSEDSIFNAPCRIRGKAGTLGRVKAGNRLDKPDGADGNKVILFGILRVIFLHNMGHQT